MPKNAFCALCLQFAELRNSHVIPNSYFRGIKALNNGKAVKFTTAEDHIARLSIDSWSEPLLCSDCESILSRLEVKAIPQLKAPILSKAPSCSGGVALENFSFEVLQAFLLSILWRASVSQQSVFEAVRLPSDFQERLRLALLNDNLEAFRQPHCQLHLLMDNLRVFTRDNLSHIVVSPSISDTNRVARFSFIFGGYLIEYFVPKMPLSTRTRLGTVRPQHRLFIPTKDIATVHKLREAIAAGSKKKLV